MNTIDIIETRVRGFIEDIQHPHQKKKINMNDLEIQLRKLVDDYFEMDGYSLFYQAIETLQAEGQLIPIQVIINTMEEHPRTCLILLG